MMKPATGQTAAAPADAQQDTALPDYAFANVVGESTAIREAIALARRVAGRSNSLVLLYGETGTGKELFARGIHASSEYESEPLVPINCAALPAALLESELFGHERGAFSGAVQQKRGLMEVAGRGTVFLDEIGELPLDLQPKLLRVLEERTIRRVGGLRELPIQCRILAATNRDLGSMVTAGKFREDLYYRLSVVRLDVPPLRERAGDIELLARFFRDMVTREHGMPPKRFAPGTLDALREHNWPGNVRELKNAVEGAILVAEGDTIHPDHILIRRRSTIPAALAVGTGKVVAAIPIPETGIPLEDVEKQLVIATLKLARNNQSEAARMLRISRPRLARLIRRYEISLSP
jgi:transcriptional regulator with GAF, ATPase, and Fis domain